jgi:hypothetical protein
VELVLDSPALFLLMLGHIVENGSITIHSVKVTNVKFERGRCSQKT